MQDEGSSLLRESLLRTNCENLEFIMKMFVAVFAVVALVACTSAAVVPGEQYDGPVYEMTPIEEPATSEEEDSNADALEPHVRERRFTCDVFSFSSKWLTPNHSACAMKCIGKRRRGGTCRNGICVCRNSRW